MDKFFTISNGGRNTPCILREPDTGRPRRVVLGVHGIAGCKEDPIQESIAEEMDLFGCAVLRFDFPAHGENEEEILSLHGCVDTLLDVADYAAERYPDLKDLCIFATGFGAYVTLTALQDLIELPCRVRLVIQTPSLRMDQTILNFTRVSAVTLEAMEMVLFTVPSRPIGFFYSFFEECRRNPAFAAYPIPMLILLKNDALQTLSWQVDTSNGEKGVPILLFNPHPFPVETLAQIPKRIERLYDDAGKGNANCGRNQAGRQKKND